MDRISVAVKVFFEEPFWIGVVERTSEEGLRVCKVTFGAEPKDCQVAEFFLEHYYRLRFSPAVEAVVRVERLNPKRMQREAHRQVQEAGIGTKSQQALKLQHERLKTERKGYVMDWRMDDWSSSSRVSPFRYHPQRTCSFPAR